MPKFFMTKKLMNDVAKPLFLAGWNTQKDACGCCCSGKGSCGAGCPLYPDNSREMSEKGKSSVAPFWMCFPITCPTTLFMEATAVCIAVFGVVTVPADLVYEAVKSAYACIKPAKPASSAPSAQEVVVPPSVQITIR